MARFALIKAGTVENVIVADDEAIAVAIAVELGCVAREVVTEDEVPITPNALVTRDCEPGGRLVDEVFERAPRLPTPSKIDEARAALEIAVRGDGAGNDAERARRALAELDGDARETGVR